MRRFGELEATIMDRLWEWDRPVTVREVLEDLRRDRTIAYTTVMTVMDTLHKKGWLRRELVGRAYRYEPLAPRESYTAALMTDALAESRDRAAAFVAFIQQMGPGDTAALRTALRQVGRRAGGA